jgi:hypothetical protein
MASRSRRNRGTQGGVRVTPPRHVRKEHDAQRAKLATQAELHAEIRERFSRLVEAEVPVPREILSIMANQEALTDLLVEAGVIPRVDLNIRRFEKLIEYLIKLEEENTDRQTAEATT